jgi:hypothetical protein
MNDPRQGLPSASNIHRLAACPGSQRMCAGVADKPTSDSDFGSHVHDFLAGRLDAGALTPEEMDIAESCMKIEARLVAEWRERHGIHADADPEITRDSERLWLRDDDERRCSGVADVVYRWSSAALILDYKTLPGDHADGAENLQLRTLACLVDEDHAFALGAADVAIIQPLKTHSPTVCQYDRAALSAARIELIQILQRASRTDAPLNPGDHCKYCRAASICPAVHKEVETLSALTINASGLTVSDEEMAKLRGKCGAAKKMIAAIEAEAFKRAQADPETWRKLGYEIKEGAGRRQVEDVRTVSERLNIAGVEWPEITAACSITIGDVEKLTRQATGEKGMKLKDKVNDVLLGCVAIKTAKPSLKRITGEDEE